MTKNASPGPSNVEERTAQPKMPTARILVLRQEQPATVWLRAPLEAQGHEVAEAGLDPDSVETVRTWNPHVVIVTLSPRHAYLRDMIRTIHEIEPTIRIVVACDEGFDGLNERDLQSLDLEGVMRLSDGPLALVMWVRAAARAWRSRVRERRRHETWRALVDVAEELRSASSSEDVLRIVLGRLEAFIGAMRAQAALAGTAASYVLPKRLPIGEGVEVPRIGCLEHPQGCSCDDELMGVLSAMTGQALEMLRLRSKVAEDDLTGVYTRDMFYKTAITSIQSVAREGGTFSLAVFDVDHFKTVNDTLGHLVGDRVLREVATTVRGTLRPQDFVGRFGGDEFLIGLRDTSAQIAYRVLERMRGTVRNRVGVEGQPVTFSCGISGFARNREAPSVRLDDDAAARILRKMLAVADDYLYESKDKGRDAVHAGQDLDLSCLNDESIGIGQRIQTA